MQEARGAVALSIIGGFLGLTILLPGLWLIKGFQPAPLGIYAAHPDYIWTLEPNSSGQRGIPLDNGETATWDVAVSDQGFRNAVIGPKNPEEFRVIFLGDSFAMGWALTPEESMPAVLERTLQDALGDRPVTVINAGVIGYGPWQSRGLLEDRGLDLDPDLVVFQLFPSNDVEGSLEAVDQHLRAYDAGWKRNLHSRINRRRWQVRFQTWIVYHIPGWRALETWTANPNVALDIMNTFRFIPKYEYPTLSPTEDRVHYLEPSLRTSYPELDEGWRLLDQEVTAAQAAAEEHGADILAFCIPEAVSVVDGLWEADVTARGLDDLYERGKEVRHAEAILSESDIPHVSILETLSGHPEASSLYYHRDRHFTPPGAELTAKALAQHILRENF
jgi:hypothetical protein